jgi:hypothetical protein
MLHVRVVSPAALTGQLTGRLATAPGVQNMVTRAGAARRPTGDAVEFDVRDGAANPVFAALRELGLDQAGVICVERVNAELTRQPRRMKAAVRSGRRSPRCGRWWRRESAMARPTRRAFMSCWPRRP